MYSKVAENKRKSLKNLSVHVWSKGERTERREMYLFFGNFFMFIFIITIFISEVHENTLLMYLC